LYSSDMVHLSRANVVLGFVRPFTHGALLRNLAKTAGYSGRTEAENGPDLANPQSGCGERKRRGHNLVPG
jgi:hypothetical protein